MYEIYSLSITNTSISHCLDSVVSKSLLNWDDTQAKLHFKFVNMNLRAFVHCSSELNWILSYKKEVYLVIIAILFYPLLYRIHSFWGWVFYFSFIHPIGETEILVSFFHFVFKLLKAFEKCRHSGIKFCIPKVAKTPRTI